VSKIFTTIFPQFPHRSESFSLTIWPNSGNFGLIIWS